MFMSTILGNGSADLLGSIVTIVVAAGIGFAMIYIKRNKK